MSSIENLIFWPGLLHSSLSYLKLKDRSDNEGISLTITKDSSLLFTQNGIIPGQASKRLNFYFDEMVPAFVEKKEINSLSDSYDDIDLFGLILFDLLKDLKENLNEQFGIEVSHKVKIILVDFYRLFRRRELCIINTLKQYSEHPLKYFDGIKLTESAIEKNQLDCDLLVVADDGLDSSFQEPDFQRTHHIDLNQIVQSLLNCLSQDGVHENKGNLLVSRLLEKLNTIDGYDWFELDLNFQSDEQANSLVVDRIHFDQIIETQLLEILNKIDNGEKKCVFLVGMLANYIYPAFNKVNLIDTQKFTREAFLKSLLCANQFVASYFPVNAPLSMYVDGEKVEEIDLALGQRKLEVNHTLRLFGRDTEIIEIELKENQQRFMKWDISINTLTALDFYEIPIEVSIDSDFNLSCNVSSTSEISINSNNLSVYDDERLRPVTAVKELIFTN